ncbi:MAG: PQQ-binding-like beta-propeller repeat protein [Candidatus Eremiobacteraeota bacterium]|nr:PQQ-binding-like beta-propeller repeat protein [Candidatus Eremiobacteraeota bacterium]
MLPSSSGFSGTLSVPAGQSAAIAITAALSALPPSGFSWARPAPFAPPTLYLRLAKTSGPGVLSGDASLSIAGSSFPAGTRALQVLFFPDGASGAAPLSASGAPIVIAIPITNAAFTVNIPFGAYSGTFAIAPISATAPADCTAMSFGEMCSTPTSNAGTELAVAISVNDPTATTPVGSAATIQTSCSPGTHVTFSNAVEPTQPNVLAISTNGSPQGQKTFTTFVSFSTPVQCDYLAPAVLFGAPFMFAGSVDASVPLASPPALNDDWTTYAHDDGRTGLELHSTIDTGNISQLTLAWRQSGVNLDPSCLAAAQTAKVFVDEASPIVSGGLVYTADVCGVVSALRRDTGDIAWQVHLPLTKDLGSTVTPIAAISGVYGTPTLDSATNTLLVPVEGIQSACAINGPPPTCVDYAHGGYIAALDATTGATKWMEPSQLNGAPGLAYGNMRGEPIVVHGQVIEGVAGGDPNSGDINGGLIALDEATGSILAQYQIAPLGGAYGDGGSSWSPISYDGSALYAGTGNTLHDDGYFDGVVQFVPTTLQPTSSFIPTYATNPLEASQDSDVGGGVLLWNGDLYFTGKSGYYYGYPIYQPNVPLFSPVLITTHTPPDGFGGIGTPTTDGNVIAVSSGRNGAGFASNLDVFPVGSGTERCSITATNSMLFSYVAWVPGIGFTPLDNQVPNGQSTAAPAFVAFDDNCNVLWEANPTDVLQFFYGGPAVVASGVYAIDVAQNVYAWKLPSMVGIESARRTGLIRPATRATFVFHHFLPKALTRLSP